MQTPCLNTIHIFIADRSLFLLYQQAHDVGKMKSQAWTCSES
jgi:hypothetical protein